MPNVSARVARRIGLIKSIQLHGYQLLLCGRQSALVIPLEHYSH
jgi:hypothetical protein